MFPLYTKLLFQNIRIKTTVLLYVCIGIRSSRFLCQRHNQKGKGNQTGAGEHLTKPPYDWRDSTIVGILERMDYCGHTVNFKSYSKSQKLKKRIPTTKEQQAIFYNTHEAIAEDAVFERVQELSANKRRPTKAERQALFSAWYVVQTAGVNYILRHPECVSLQTGCLNDLDRL